MSENAKKGLIISLIILLLVGIAFLIYWGVTNYEKVQEGLNGTGLYTSIDLENAKKEGYLEGANSLQELEKQLQDLKAQLDTKTKSVTELTNRVTELTNANNELLENKSENEQIIIDKNLEIQSLNEQITLLNNEIIRLNKLLEAYSNYEGQTYTATFYVDDTAVDVKVVDGGSILSQELIPTKTGDYKYTFKGWSFDKENIIELSSYVVNENLNLYAVFEQSYYSITEYTQGHVSKIFAISTKEEFKQFSDFVNSGNTFESKTILLLNDIDLQDFEVNPIGNYYRSINGEVDLYFSGVFDGNGHTINNFTLDNSMQSGGYFKYTYGGLFSRVKDAVIKNLNLINANVISWTSYGNAILCGSYVLSSDKSIEDYGLFNCFVNGTLQIGNSPSGRDGILIGSGKLEVIHNCRYNAQAFDLNNNELPVYSNGRLTEN